MDKKYLFNDIVLNYEKSRPCYTAQLFETIMHYADITENKSVIEIGCGTGKATEPFLKTDCKVTAVELGENLASYTSKKFKNYTNLEMIQSSFEEYACENNQFDLLYSATAFHWIPPEIGYKKAYRIIKSGGSLALFWNRPSVYDKEDPLYQKIQSLYHEFVPQWDKNPAENQSEQIAGIQKQIAEYAFIDIELHLYHNTRTMTGEEYVELLNTYSDHLALDKQIRVPFYSAIRTVIEESGNKMILHDTVDLHLAHKP